MGKLYGKPKESESGVYMILNINSRKIYIGQTQNFRSRFNQHFNSLKNGTHQNEELQQDYNEGDEFVFCILEKLKTHNAEKLLLREKFYVLAFYDKGIELYNKVTKEKVLEMLCYDLIYRNAWNISETFYKKYRINLASLYMCKPETLKKKFSGADQ